MNTKAVALNTFYLTQLSEKQKQEMLDCGGLKSVRIQTARTLFFKPLGFVHIATNNGKRKRGDSVG